MLVLTEADLTVGARGPGLLRARKTQTLHIFRMQLLLRTSFLSRVKPDSMFVLYSLISLTTKAQNQNDKQLPYAENEYYTGNLRKVCRNLLHLLLFKI